MKIQIRDMTKTDLSQVGDTLFEAFNGCASKYGYSPKMQSVQEGTSWAWALLRHGPRELLVAEAENRVAGICCLNPRGNHGGIGPVAVNPAFQGYGIGRQLMDALLKRADGLQSVRLFVEAFNPASFNMYYTLGLMPVAVLLDMFVKAGPRLGACTSSHISELTANDLDEVCTYDIARSGFDRRTDFAYYAKWGKVLVYKNQSQIQGVLACLPSPQSVQLGPLVAEGEEEGKCLFRHALAVFNGRPAQTRVMARDHLFVGALRESGFQLYSLNVLMVRGSWQPSRYIEAFGRFPEGV